jgi:hypothetical protein
MSIFQPDGVREPNTVRASLGLNLARQTHEKVAVWLSVLNGDAIALSSLRLFLSILTAPPKP